MVNDDNDKWTDNGDLPINPAYSSNQLEEEKLKRRILKNQINDQKEMSMEELMKNSKHKEMSMEELIKNSKHKEMSIKNIATNDKSTNDKSTNDKSTNDKSTNDKSTNDKSTNDKSKKESIKNMENVPTRSGAKVYIKEEPTKRTTDTLAKFDIKANVREESTKSSTKNGESKNIPSNVATKEVITSREEQSKDIITSREEPSKEIITSREEPTTDTILNDIQKLKDQLKKLKEETREPQYLKDLSKYIKNLDSNIVQLASGLKTFTDAKSWEAISRGNLDIRRYANYYDIHGLITAATASDPHDFDSAAYNVERIFESLERFAEIIYVANDGTDNLYVIVSHGGRTRFSTEAIVYPGEVKCYWNVYEIRLRSPTAGLQYRVTEYCLANISEISSIPIEKANLHNQALPAINTNWLATDIIPTNTPTTFMIEVAVSVSGIFSAAVTRSGNTQTVMFNVVSGPALIAGGVYIFDLLVHNGDSVNFIYSATGGTIQLLRTQELDSASA